ncbi:MAG: acetyl-CoA C-acetyltransferase [Bacteroidia bacterium]|jgi:acetyl-CoA C-acetyltransferase|nr:acetyl-CoA C-acetyltransferase [Bacteroidia bacterium]GIV23487.1 MAG: acetyl-CoA acetyltransferase [Bacteroidia bacterium]
MFEVYIYDAVRTPRGRGKKDGKLHPIRPVELVRQLIQALLARNPALPPESIEDLILGCVTQIMEQGSNIAKVAAQVSGLPETVAGVTLNRFCASGLEAINQASTYLRAGVGEAFLAGGVESMSRVPMGSDGGAWYMDPAVAFPGYFIPQGISADLIATLYGYDRERLDRFALRSHQRAAHATQKGYFQKSLIPVRDELGQVVLDKDENIRPDTSLEKLATLEPSFAVIGQQFGYDAVAIQKYPEVEAIQHVHHAGNSSAIVDGAALVLLGTEAVAKKYGLRPRARIVSWAVTGTEPTIMLLGPAPATRKALQRAGLSPEQIDLYEVNEAFAAVPLRFMEEMGIPEEKVNVNGGAIAMGHPLGATGAILLGTLLDELERQNRRYGVATLCVGGGMGIATVIERI